MKIRIKRFLLLTLTGLGLTGTAMADSYYDYARVKKVRPVYKYIKQSEPVEHCYQVRRARRSSGSALFGAAVGGIIGNSIGENRASTIAGAVIGGAIGHHADRDRTYRYETRCDLSHNRVRKVRTLSGYNVTYRYDGQSYRTFMHHHPGDKIRVRVKVSPVY